MLHKWGPVIMVGGMVASVIPVWIGEQMTYSRLNSDRKRLYKFSVWDSEVDEKEKLKRIHERTPMIDVLRNLFELKIEDESALDQHFAENVLYEQPHLRTENRRDMLLGFNRSKLSDKAVELKKFDIFHSQDCIHIVCEKKVPTLFGCEPIIIPSTIVVNLRVEDDREKVSSFVDEIKNTALISADDNRFAQLAVLYRKATFKLFYFQRFVKNKISDTIHSIFNDDDDDFD